MQQTWQRLLVFECLDGSSLPFVHARIIPSGTEATPWRVPIYVKRVLPVLAVAALLAPASQARSEGGGALVAFVTAETMNELLAISLPDGRVLKRLRMPADPENVEASDRTAVVVSTRGAAVTLVDLRRLRVVKVLRDFGLPHIPLIGRDGRDRKSTRLNSSHRTISYAAFCLKKKKTGKDTIPFNNKNTNYKTITSS